MMANQMGDMHISGRSRGIADFDLDAVFATEEERAALSLVKSLDLAHNKLQRVRSLQPLTALVVLDLSHNKITQLTGLPLGLTRLNLAHNQLRSLDGVAALPNLRELDVSHNRLVSVAGLSIVSPLVVLNAAHNRLAKVPHLDALTKLRVLDLDANFIDALDALAFLRSLVTLQSASFRGCPVAEVADYRDCVLELVPTLQSLDGVAVTEHDEFLRQQRSREASCSRVDHDERATSSFAGAEVSSRGEPTASASTRRRPAAFASSLVEKALGADRSRRHTDCSTTGSEPDSGRITSSSLLLSRTEDRRAGLSAKVMQLERELRDAQAQGAQLERDNKALVHANTTLQQQLRELRRVMTNELDEVARGREENARLTEELAACKARLARATRDAKYGTENAKASHLARIDALEKQSVQLQHENRQLQHELVSARRVLASAPPRPVRDAQVMTEGLVEALGHPVPTQDAHSRKGALDQEVQEGRINAGDSTMESYTTSSSSSGNGGGGSSGSSGSNSSRSGCGSDFDAAHVAENLKQWVMKEMNITDVKIHTARTHVTPKLRPAADETRAAVAAAASHRPLGAPSSVVRELWARNEALLAEAKRPRVTKSRAVHQVGNNCPS